MGIPTAESQEASVEAVRISEGGPPIPGTADPRVQSTGDGGAGRAPTGSPSGVPISDEDVAKYERVVAKLLSAGDTGHYSLAVTSSVSGEGVSTACVGLAVALATSTAGKVLLVDANLRRPSLHEWFGAPPGPGLGDLVAGSAHQPVFGTKVPNLWLLPSGVAQKHPAQLMTSEAARVQIQGFRTHFDYVVIDCPPVLSTVEAASVCRLADGVIIVLRAGLTPREDVSRTKGLLAGAPIMGVILNGV